MLKWHLMFIRHNLTPVIDERRRRTFSTIEGKKPSSESESDIVIVAG